MAADQRSGSCERGTWSVADTQQAGLDLSYGDKVRAFILNGKLVSQSSPLSDLSLVMSGEN